MAGSAGTFSFRAASELGRVLEEHPSDTGDVDNGDDAQVPALRWLDLVNQLRQALAQPADAASPPDRGGQHR